MCTRPSTPGRISTKAPNVTTFVTFPSTTSPSLCCSSTCCHGSDCVCLRPSEMRWRSRSMSSTFTFTVWPISSTSDGWFTCAQVEDQSALHDLDHAAVHRLTGLGGALDRLPGELEAGALLREDQPPFSVLLRHHQRVDLVADRHLVGGVHGPPDRELGDRNHALRLVTDIHEHLVLVHPDDLAVNDLALVDGRESGLVVRDQLTVGAGDPDAVAGNPLFGLFGRHKRSISIARGLWALGKRQGPGDEVVRGGPSGTS